MLGPDEILFCGDCSQVIDRKRVTKWGHCQDRMINVGPKCLTFPGCLHSLIQLPARSPSLPVMPGNTETLEIFGPALRFLGLME